MFRQLALNLITVTVTLAALSAIAFGVIRSVPPAGGAAVPSIALNETARLIGVVSDPWQVDRWDDAIGEVDVTMQFSAWGRRSDLGDFLAEAGRQGKVPMVTWEPWSTANREPGESDQGRLQARFSNAAIANGRQDHYVRSVAADVARFEGPVFIRYAHEMNGWWYPWSHQPRRYVEAWRHVHDLFEREGATNAVWVWSANTNLFEGARVWRRRLTAYWPGDRYVDWVGSTMINFGGVKEHSPGEFLERIALLRDFQKPVMVTEANVHWGGRLAWLRKLRRELARAPWVRALIWSQAPSLGGQTLEGIGDMDWSALSDEESAALLRVIGRDANSPPEDHAPRPVSGRLVARPDSSKHTKRPAPFKTRLSTGRGTG